MWVTAATGIILAYSAGFLVPDSKTDMLADEQIWRLIGVYFPLGIYIFFLLGCFCIAKYDSIKWYVNNV